MEEVEIPSYFLCPISLELMKDPVTLSTGITYHRDSIERWIFERRKRTCPVTKLPLSADDVAGELTPNHTLRRLIQAWCTLHCSSGVERIPTPKSPVDKAQIAALLRDAEAAPPQLRLASLRELRQIAAASERSRRCVEATPGALDFLASVVTNQDDEEDTGCASSLDEALIILHTLQISDEGLLDLAAKNPNLIESLTAILRRSSFQSRSYAILILKSLLGLISPARLVALQPEVYGEIVNVIRDGISLPATKAALHSLIALCSWGRNRVMAAKVGAVHAIIELLLENPGERRLCELALASLDFLCSCAEGRAELVRHRAAVALVSKKILRVSQLASEKSVRVLNSVARHSSTPAVLEEMVQVGAVTKLCMVIQAGHGGKMEEKAKEILRLHTRAWEESPCLAPLFKISS